MAAETNQAIVCLYCGREMNSREEVIGFPYVCLPCVKKTAGSFNMLSAKTKHGASLGEHHVESVTKRTSKFKDSLDRHYHEIMLAEMTLELVLILVLVILAWKQS